MGRTKKNEGDASNNRPNAMTHELRLRQYHYWVSKRKASNNDPGGADLVTGNRNSPSNPPHRGVKEWPPTERWGGGSTTDGVTVNSHTATKGDSADKAKTKRQAMRYWLRRAAHPRSPK